MRKRFYLAMVRRNPEFMESIWEQNKLFNDAFSREDQKRDYKYVLLLEAIDPIKPYKELLS